jgi:hypothetical protein
MVSSLVWLDIANGDQSAAAFRWRMLFGCQSPLEPFKHCKEILNRILAEGKRMHATALRLCA